VAAMHTGVSHDMLICMRTTINLPDGLAEAARERAAAEGRTFTSIVEEGLRTVLARDAESTPDELPLPEFGIEGGGFKIDLADRDAVWHALGGDSAA
jgi:plasmid stability protein